MKAVLFAPHNDDETLFAFYTMRRYQAEVVVVLRSHRQHEQQGGPHFTTRERETLCATEVAGVSYVQWTTFSDIDPDWDLARHYMQQHIYDFAPRVVIAPAWEEDGHEDHNAVAEIAAGLIGNFSLMSYLTYRRGHGRSSDAREINPTVEESDLKAAALRCYHSQLKHPPCASWFGADQREFIR